MGFFLRFFLKSLFYPALMWLVYRFIADLDTEKVVYSHTPGQCRHIAGIEHGAEAVDILPSGLVILSTGLSFTRKLTSPDRKPGIMVFNISSSDRSAKNLSLTGFKGHLNPHGMSLFLENGKTYVYVINHPLYNEHPPVDKVEKFLWNVDKGELVHQKTFTDPEFAGLNDLVVIGPDQFYICNFQSSHNDILRQIEQFLWFVPVQNVVYYDGINGTIVINRVAAANGIDVSPDRKYLYVSESNKKRVSSYRIDSPTNLVLVDHKYLDILVDNINVNADTGDLWVAGHPIGHKLFRKAAASYDTNIIPPSQVFRVEVSKGKFKRVEDIFADDGKKLSLSSSAVYHKETNRFVIGTMIDRAMVCECDACGL